MWQNKSVEAVAFQYSQADDLYMDSTKHIRSTENIPYERGRYGVRFLINNKVVGLKDYSISVYTPPTDKSDKARKQAIKDILADRKFDVSEWLRGNNVEGGYSIR